MIGTGATGFAPKYMRVNNDKFADPSLGEYKISNKAPDAGSSFNASAQNGTIYYQSSKTCSDTGEFKSAGSRSFAVAIILESNDIYCENS